MENVAQQTQVVTPQFSSLKDSGAPKTFGRGSSSVSRCTTAADLNEWGRKRLLTFRQCGRQSDGFLTWLGMPLIAAHFLRGVSEAIGNRDIPLPNGEFPERGGEWVPLSRLEIARLMGRNFKKGDEESARNYVSNARAALKDFQEQTGLLFLEMRDGSQKQKAQFREVYFPAVIVAEERKRADSRFYEKAGRYATDEEKQALRERKDAVLEEHYTRLREELRISDPKQDVEEVTQKAKGEPQEDETLQREIHRVEKAVLRIEQKHGAGAALQFQAAIRMETGRALFENHPRFSRSESLEAAIRHLVADLERIEKEYGKEARIEALEALQGSSSEKGGGLKISNPPSHKSNSDNANFQATFDNWHSSPKTDKENYNMLGTQREQQEPEIPSAPDLEDELSWGASAEANGADPEELGREALELCQSVGAGAPLEVSFLNDEKKGQAGYLVRNIKSPSQGDSNRLIGSWLEEAERHKSSFVPRVTGRPEEGNVRPVIQLDDCSRETLLLLRPFSFWQVRTSWSETGFQCWLALEPVEGESQEELYRRKQELISRILPVLNRDKTDGEVKVNGGSRGSVRWPGSRNWKPKHRRADGTAPLIETIYKSPGRYVTLEELEQAGLLIPAPPPPAPRTDAPPEPPPSPVFLQDSNGLSGEHYKNGCDRVTVKAVRQPPPSYRRSIERVIAKGQFQDDGKTPNWSEVDFDYAVVAFKRGYSIEDVESMLRENRLNLCHFHPLATEADANKAHRKGKDYIRLTVQNAWSLVQTGHYR